MRRANVIAWCFLLAVFFPFVRPALAQDGGEKAPTLRTGVLSGELRLDGRLDEPMWLAADSITNLLTIEPEEGGVPAGRTIVRVLASSHEIVIGVICLDPAAAAIVSFSKARDSDLEQEDHVVFVLDTFRDARSGYIFAVNPGGARYDAIVAAQGEEANSNWDAVWEARTARDQNGWSAEIRIPIRSISFGKGLTSWGFNVQRRVQRLQETSRWSGAIRDYEIFQTSRAGVLSDVPRFDLGWGLSVRTAGIGGFHKPAPDAERDFTDAADLFALDVTQRLGPNLTASLTVNTDFAETEIDARQTNLSRFDIFFPEKRSFFLEGADIFEFGLGLDENLVPFFSRRIGLFDPAVSESPKISIIGGGKLNGRVGNTNLGGLVIRTDNVALDVEDEAPVRVPETTVGVVRLKQNVLDESSVGMIASFGDPLGRSGSWSAGVDLTYQTSRFQGDKNFLVGIWGLTSDRDDLQGDRSAYGFKIDYPNDLLDIALTSIRIGEDFQPSLGFVPRTGVVFWEIGGDFNPRPGWRMVRQMFHEMSLLLFTDLSHRWESYELVIKPFDWLLESGDKLTVEIVPSGDRPAEAFDVFESETNTVEISAGSYRWARYSVGGTLAEKRKISGGIRYEFGSFYGGDLQTMELELGLKPWPVLALELSGERNRGDLPEGKFTQYLYGGRAELKPSPDFQVSSFLQYDNESRSFGTNSRLRWTFHPLGDLFIVYNHNLLRSIGQRQRFGFESNQLLVKFQYAWRF